MILMGISLGFDWILMDIQRISAAFNGSCIIQVFEWIVVNFHGGSPLIRSIVSKEIRLGCCEVCSMGKTYVYTHIKSDIHIQNYIDISTRITLHDAE